MIKKLLVILVIFSSCSANVIVIHDGDKPQKAKKTEIKKTSKNV